MIWIDKKYALMLPLDQPSQVNNGSKHWMNFRCFVCGDSFDNKNKKRGWFIENGQNLSFHCYNCGAHMYFGKMLKTYYLGYYKDYIKEKMKEGSFLNYNTPQKIEKIDNFFEVEVKIPLQSIQDLPDNHYARMEILKRKIPKKFWDDIYYVDNYKLFCNENDFYQYQYVGKRDRRFLLVGKNRHKSVVCFHARALDKQEPKYLINTIGENGSKFYGLDRVDISKNVYATEGAIDSLFLDNGVGLGGAISEITKLTELIPKDRIIVVPDNEPRNKNTMDFTKKSLILGFKTVIWPEKLKLKDINMMAIEGIDYKTIIEENTFQGMKGNLMLSRKRVM